MLVAPPIWSGFTHFNMGHIGTLNVRLETFMALVGDVCRSLKANGFERMILLNGHGGNVAPLRTLSVQLAEEYVWALAFPYVSDHYNWLFRASWGTGAGAGTAARWPALGRAGLAAGQRVRRGG